METPIATQPGRDPTPEAGDERFFEWLTAHAKPRPGWDRHTIPLQLFDPIPPAQERPALLLRNLVDGDVLPLERVEVPGRRLPEFIVRTECGRELGRLPAGIAGTVEASRLEGFDIEVSVFAAVPGLPAETVLMLELDLVVWCDPADWVERPAKFTFRRVD